MGALALSPKLVLAAAVANAGTLTVSYPSGTNQAFFTGQTGLSQAVVDGATYPEGSGAGTIAVAYGASNITVTNNSGVTWPAGAEVFVSFGRVDINGSYNLTYPRKVQTAVG